MKIGFYNDFRPCIVKEDGVVDISREVQQFQGGSPQLTLENIIVNFQFLRPMLERLEGELPEHSPERRATAAASPPPGQGPLWPGQLHGRRSGRAGAPAGNLLSSPLTR